MDRQLGTGKESESYPIGQSLMRYIKVTKWKMEPLLFELLQTIFARLWKTYWCRTYLIYKQYDLLKWTYKIVLEISLDRPLLKLNMLMQDLPALLTV